MKRLALLLLLLAAPAQARDYVPQPVTRVVDPLIRSILIRMDEALLGFSRNNAGTGPPIAGSFVDNGFYIVDDGDFSKRFQFQASSISASTTRTLTVQNNSYTLAGTNISQTFSAAQTFQPATDVVGTIFKGHSGGTANLSEWQNSAGTVQTLVEPDGDISGGTANTGTLELLSNSVSASTRARIALTATPEVRFDIPSGSVDPLVLSLGLTTGTLTGNSLGVNLASTGGNPSDLIVNNDGGSASNVPVIIEAHATQDSALLRFRSSTAAKLAEFTAGGNYRLISGSALNKLYASDANGIGSWQTLSAVGGTNALLDGVNHTDATNSPVTRGDLIIGNSTPAWDDLAIGSANTVLQSDGTDPSWGSLTHVHMSNRNRTFFIPFSGYQYDFTSGFTGANITKGTAPTAIAGWSMSNIGTTSGGTQIVIPSDWSTDNQSATWTLMWVQNATTTGQSWVLNAYADVEVDGDDVTGANSHTLTAGRVINDETQNLIQMEDFSTLATFSPGDFVRLNFQREGGHASDNCTSVIIFIGVKVTYSADM